MNEKMKLPGVGVGVMILNEKGEVLLGKRHEDPEKADSLLKGEGMWTIPGGKLEFREGIAECAKREAFEECSLKVDGLELVSICNDMVDTAHFVTLGFLARKFEGRPRVMEPDEITEWRWFRLDSLPEPMFPPTLKLINNYKKKQILGE